MELSSSNILKFLMLLIFLETETPKKKKFPYISGNGNPQKASYISENETLHFSVQA